MKLTPMLVAAFLLAAAAPSASALCVGNRACAEANVQGVNKGTGEATGTAIEVVGLVLSIGEDLAVDEDGDSFPDAAEMAICGNDLLFGLTNQDAVPGHCATRSDYIPPPVIPEVVAVVMFVLNTAMDAAEELVKAGGDLAQEVERIARELLDTAVDAANQAYRAVDGDADSVPDALEPLICTFAENENLAQDGSCTADNQDYDPPL
jgi:hypothetical protein